MDKQMIEEIEKSKKIAHITLVIIGILIFLIVILFIGIKVFFKEISKNDYYYLEINSNNKEYVTSLLEERNINYCDSIYKIEYEQLFPDDKDGKIYCKDEDNIKFSMQDDSTENKLANYIRENGIHKKR